MVSRKAKLAVEKVFFNTETNLPRPKIPVINLPNLEKILQNPDTELKAQIQNQMREEQLKQAIEEAAEIRYGLRDTKTNVIQRNCFRAGVEYTLFKSSNTLRHADPEIMKKAGWVKIEDILKFNPAMAEYYMQHNYREMYAIWERIREEITPLQPSKR